MDNIDFHDLVSEAVLKDLKTRVEYNHYSDDTLRTLIEDITSEYDCQSQIVN